jgi:hypothetical protein
MQPRPNVPSTRVLSSASSGRQAGVPSARDLSRLALLKSKYPLPSVILDELLEKLRVVKP